MIKAIQTAYKGYNFRSRLEARWAVFFDALGLKWEYEPEGFELPTGRYLPDFRVTAPCGLVCWYEVKPRAGVDTKMAALKAMAEQEAGRESPFDALERFHVLVGDPVEAYANGHKCCHRCGFISNNRAELMVQNLNDLSANIYCWACDLNTPCGGDHPEFNDGLLGPYTPHKGALMYTASAWRYGTRRLADAANAARSARFEFNASGRTL